MSDSVIIVLCSYDVRVLDTSTRLITNEVVKLETVKFTGPFPLPTKERKVTVLSSPHKHKKAQKNFVKSLHRRLIKLTNIEPNKLQKLGNTKIPDTVHVILKTNV